MTTVARRAALLAFLALAIARSDLDGFTPPARPAPVAAPSLSGDSLEVRFSDILEQADFESAERSQVPSSARWTADRLLANRQLAKRRLPQFLNDWEDCHAPEHRDQAPGELRLRA